MLLSKVMGSGAFCLAFVPTCALYRLLASGKSLCLLEPHFPCLENGDNSRLIPIGLPQDTMSRGPATGSQARAALKEWEKPQAST